MSTPFEFPRPAPGSYAKVKDATNLRLCAQDGTKAVYDVGVWLRRTGTPMFCISLPQDWCRAWRALASTDEQASGVVSLEQALIESETFDRAVKALERVSDIYHEYIARRTMEKVIVLQMNLLAPGINYGATTACYGSHLVGIKSMIRYQVCGRLYRDTRHNKWLLDHEDGTRDALAPLPQFDELSLAAPVDKYVVVPYSDAAWNTIKSVEETVDRAAGLLKELLDDGKRDSMLLAGLPAILALAAPATEIA